MPPRRVSDGRFQVVRRARRSLGRNARLAQAVSRRYAAKRLGSYRKYFNSPEAVSSKCCRLSHPGSARSCRARLQYPSGLTNIQDRAPYLVDVIEGQRRSHGPFGFWLNGLRPKAGKAVAVRDKVDAVSIRGPARFVVPVLVADDPDPVALFRRGITLKGRGQHLQASSEKPACPRPKSNPAAIVSEVGVKQLRTGKIEDNRQPCQWQG